MDYDEDETVQSYDDYLLIWIRLYSDDDSPSRMLLKKIIGSSTETLQDFVEIGDDGPV